MKSMILVVLALVAIAAAAPADKDDIVPIIRSEYDQKENGYVFNYESADGTRREETGELKQVNDEDDKLRDVVVVRGSFTYTNPDGTVETVEYEADEKGYRAFGPSIPKAVSRR